MTTLKHRLQDDGFVSIQMGDHLGKVTESAARRFAWALLADLEPEDPEVVAKEDRGHGYQRRAILRALSERELVYHEVASATGIKTTVVPTLLSQLKNAGLIERTQAISRPYEPSSWRLTQAGRDRLAHLDAHGGPTPQHKVRTWREASS